MNHKELSKTVSHALRHEPWIYELELDDEGWTTIEALLQSLKSMKTQWSQLTITDLQSMIEKSAKIRHEISGDKIRAIYGHSVPGKLKRIPAEPPEILFHGTSPEAFEVIMQEGLKPMERQYVHLSINKEIAMEVGKRKTATPVILEVKAKKAHEQGMRFYQGNDKIWLADQIPSHYCYAI